MKISFIWDGNYPWDVRVEKICLSLLDAGHEIHMICRNTRYQARNEIISGIHIHRLPVVKKSDFFNKIINFPIFFSPIWYKAISNVFNMQKIDVAIVRDITLSLTTLRVAKRKRIPVILDMAEPYPEMIKAQHMYEKLKGIKRIIRNVKVAEWVEKQTLTRVSSIFAMIEESRDRMLAMGIPERKISIVSNTPDMRRFQRGRPSFPGSMGELRSNTIFLYIGFLDLYRGLQVAIQGLREVLERDPKVFLVIVGNGGGEAELKRLARYHNVHNHIVFEGYQHHSLIPDYIASCDVGIIPHFSCGLWNNTIPNKLFDYMAMSKPVLSSDARPVRRILNEEKCGIVYNNNDRLEFGKQAILLLDQGMREDMGKNGLMAVKRKYNWNFDSKKLLNGIEKLPFSRFT